MFDVKSKSLIETASPSMLHIIRLITDEDSEILKAVRNEYSLIDENSNIFEKATCTIVASILLQERLYFNLTLREFRKLLDKDPNHKFPVVFHNRAWPKILHALYNQMGIMQLVQQGSFKTASTYRVTHKAIAEYLLATGIDAKAQKAEALEFTNRRFVKPE